MDQFEDLLAVLRILDRDRVLQARMKAQINLSKETITKELLLLGGKLEIKLTFDERMFLDEHELKAQA